jgi:hypothetical protein
MFVFADFPQTDLRRPTNSCKYLNQFVTIIASRDFVWHNRGLPNPRKPTHRDQSAGKKFRDVNTGETRTKQRRPASDYRSNIDFWAGRDQQLTSKQRLSFYRGAIKKKQMNVDCGGRYPGRWLISNRPISRNMRRSISAREFYLTR